MSTLSITWVAPEPNEYNGQNGTVYYYNVAGNFEGESKKTSIGVKSKDRAPKVGDDIEGHFETVNGKEKFKKAAPQGNFGGSKPAFSGGGSKREYVPSPASEIPYLSLKAAVEFASAKVSAKLDITGEQVVGMAQVFQKYLEGQELAKKEEAKTDAEPTPEPPLFPEPEMDAPWEE
jgi:hypothetical protein